MNNRNPRYSDYTMSKEKHKTLTKESGQCNNKEMRENAENEIGNEIIVKCKKILKNRLNNQIIEAFIKKERKKVRILKKRVCNQIITHKENLK